MRRPYYSEGGVTIFHGDCREVLAELGETDVSHVVTDPPYGTGGWRRGERGAGANPSGSLVVEVWDDGTVAWLGLLPATTEGVLTFWPAARTSALLAEANRLGLTKHRALYMRKRDPKPQVSGRVAWSVEPVWVLSRDGMLLYGGTDVVDTSTPRLGRDAEAVGHPYQKPVAVMGWLLAKLANPRTVLDPFMGSGSTLVAAKRAGLGAIGIEADEAWCEQAAERLRQSPLPFTADVTPAPETPSLFGEVSGA